MNGLQIFQNDSFGQIRTVLRDGDPWFVAVDVCRALEIGNTSQTLTRLDNDEKGIISNDTPGGAQEMTVINEPGLYSLVLGSRKPEAKAFKRWITHEVIPAIRKHGGYMTPQTVEQALLNPDVLIQLATNLKKEQQERIRLEEKVMVDQPKVAFAEAVASSPDSILVTDLAKMLRQNGIKTGQNRLYEQMRQDGFLCSAYGERWNTPTQRAMEMGLFEIKKNVINTPEGAREMKPTTKISGKGQVYFMRRYGAKDAGLSAH